jgi:FtsP/CotA-like multicopper oxidase with cupredoxin domain
MQSRKTAALLGVAALIAAVAVFIVLQNDSGSDGGSGTTAAPPGQASKPKVPAKSGGRSGSGGASTGRQYDLRFANGAAVGGSEDITATQGQRLTVSLHTDAPAELHIHGYELSKDVDAGGTGSITFTADATGVFEVEAHPLVHGEEGTGVELAHLQVNP